MSNPVPPTSRITTREVPHPQNCDQGGSPQAELRPGSLHTTLPASRITTRELASWLAGWLGGLYIYDQEMCPALGLLAGWLGVWLVVGRPWVSSGFLLGLLPYMLVYICCGPRGAQRGGAWIEQACHALGWRLPASRITTREPTHKQNYDQGTGWLAGWLAEFRRGSLSCALLAGWLGGWLAG